MESTSGAGTPSSRRRRPRGPNIGLVKDCVAIAPIPLAACEQRAPVAKALVVTATPSRPLEGSRATIDHVISGSLPGWRPALVHRLCGHEAGAGAALDRRG